MPQIEKERSWAKPKQLPAGPRKKRPLGRLFSSIITLRILTIKQIRHRVDTTHISNYILPICILHSTCSLINAIQISKKQILKCMFGSYMNCSMSSGQTINM